MSQILIPGTATPDKVLSGSTFSAGVNYNTPGTMPNNDAVTITPGTVAKTIAAGYHNGNGTVVGDPNLIPVNIRAGTTIFGVTGTANRVASGTVTSSASQSTFASANGANTPESWYSVTVSGLTFLPSKIIVVNISSTGYDHTVYDATDPIAPNYPKASIAKNQSGVGGTSSSWLYQLGAGGVGQVSASSFTLPVYTASAQYKWYAIE